MILNQLKKVESHKITCLKIKRAQSRILLIQNHIVKAHEMQLFNYLTSTGKTVGLIINFGELKVEIKRKVKDLKNID